LRPDSATRKLSNVLRPTAKISTSNNVSICIIFLFKGQSKICTISVSTKL
jgi:hypothetical protein